LQSKAYAKVNLALAVTGRRADGYHFLDTVFCPIDLCDTLRLEAKESGGIAFGCSDAALLTPDNLVVRAASLFASRFGLRLNVRFDLEKRIPAQSGLGGGSADAAAALRMLSSLYPGTADEKSLFDMALSLGADVPYALSGGFVRAAGIGERFTGLAGMPKLHFVLLKPEQGLSTPAVFAMYDSMPEPDPPDVSGAVSSLLEGDLFSFSKKAGNALQPAVQELCPEVGRCLDLLYGSGAAHAAVTGSGSAVFGLFPDEKEAMCAATALDGAVPFCAYVRSCQSDF